MISSNIEIIGTIGVDVLASTVREQLAAAGDEICIYIDSPGGDVIESNAISLAIAEYVIRNPQKTYTCTLGSLTASAAANILAKLPDAVSVNAYKDSLIMYHSCSGIVEGTPQQLRDVSMMMSLVNEAVIRELTTKTTLPVDEVKAALCGSGELWLDAKKALAVGLIDGIIGEDADVLKYTENNETRAVLALVAQYKRNKGVNATMDEKKETDQVIEEIELETEAKPEEIEKKDIIEEVEKEIEEKPEVDIDAIKAECEELKAENEQLKKEIEGLKALVAKYRPSVKASTKAAPKADWASLVRELNAKHLNSKDYDREYLKLKAENKNAFDAFMQGHSIR